MRHNAMFYNDFLVMMGTQEALKNRQTDQLDMQIYACRHFYVLYGHSYVAIKENTAVAIYNRNLSLLN